MDHKLTMYVSVATGVTDLVLNDAINILQDYCSSIHVALESMTPCYSSDIVDESLKGEDRGMGNDTS